jgi:hypothetical protein
MSSEIIAQERLGQLTVCSRVTAAKLTTPSRSPVYVRTSELHSPFYAGVDCGMKFTKSKLALTNRDARGLTLVELIVATTSSSS